MHVGFLFQDIADGFPKFLDNTQPADPPFRALGGVIEKHDRSFLRDARNRA